MDAFKKPIKHIDIYNEQFNHFFVEKLNTLTEKQRELIPLQLIHKIFQRGVNASAERLNFNEKLWILSVVFQHNVTIMIDGKENAMSISDFVKSRKAQKKQIENSELLDDMRVHSAFVIADKELMAASLYMNHVSCSNIYSLVKQFTENVNHKVNQKFLANKKGVNMILNFLVNYEANKKRLATDYGLTIGKWYALLYFSTGEHTSASFYKEAFLYAYSSSSYTLHKEMKWMYDQGYLFRRGSRNGYKYVLTSAGVNLLGRIMDNLLLKF